MSEPRNSKSWMLVIIAVVAVLVIGGVWRWSGDDKERIDEDQAADASPLGSTTKAQTRAGPRVDSGEALLVANKAVISGTIRDEQGQAIAGATVCAWADQGELLGAGDQLPRCATSEADGHYHLAGLWPVSSTVSASAPSFMPAKWRERVNGRWRDDIRLRSGAEVREIDIVLEHGGVAVRGVVKDISGGVIDDALVSVSAGRWFGNNERAVTRTDDEGRFELWAKPGSNSLKAHAEGYAPADARVVAPTDLAELFLTPESVISGTVVHAQTGAPVAQVTVRTATAGFFGSGSGSALSDNEGHFRIAGLEPGIYDLTGIADELYGEGAEQLHLGLAQSAADVIVRVHPAFSLTGTIVVTETGEPCPEGSIQLEGGGRDTWASSDESGEILVRGLLPAEYEVKVRCDDHVPENSYEAVVIVDESLAGVEWKVHTGLAIRGVVVDSDGAPLADINISGRAKATTGADPRGQRTSSWGSDSEDDGSFELMGLLPGTYELNIWSRDYPRLDEPQVVELGAGADLDGVRLVLLATGRVVGIVVDSDGAPMPGVGVSVTSLGEHHSRTRSQSGDDGRFTLEHVHVGTARVSARIGWAEGMRAPGTSDDDIQGETVEVVAKGEAEVELVLQSRALAIRGRVVDSTGAPVGDAFVDSSRMSDSAAAGGMRSRWSMRWGWDRQPVLSDSDGSFEINELAEGNYLIRAYREGGGEAIVEGIAAGSSGVELTIVDTGSIAGTVSLAGGGNPERFEIQAYDKSQALTRSDEVFRSAGAFVLRELPPGAYEVTVSSEQGSAKTEVELSAGQAVEGLNLELVPMLVVVGRLIDADTRAPVPGMKVQIGAVSGGIFFSGMDGTGEHKDVSDSDGRFEVEDVPSGVVRLWAMPRDFGDDSGYGWTNRQMTLAAEPERQDIGEIELLGSRLDRNQKAGDLGFKTKQLGPEVEPEDRYFEVAVIRPGGPAEGSELEVGDRIAEVDGRGVTGLDSHRYSTLTQAPPGAAIELAIDGGKSVTVTLGPPVE